MQVLERKFHHLEWLHHMQRILALDLENQTIAQIRAIYDVLRENPRNEFIWDLYPNIPVKELATYLGAQRRDILIATCIKYNLPHPIETPKKPIIKPMAQKRNKRVIHTKNQMKKQKAVIDEFAKFLKHSSGPILQGVFLELKMQSSIHAEREIASNLVLVQKQKRNMIQAIVDLAIKNEQAVKKELESIREVVRVQFLQNLKEETKDESYKLTNTKQLERCIQRMGQNQRILCAKFHQLEHRMNSIVDLVLENVK